VKKIIFGLGLCFLYLSLTAWGQEPKPEAEEGQTITPAQGATAETPGLEKPVVKPAQGATAQAPEKAKPGAQYPAKEIDRPLLIPPKSYEMRTFASYFSTHQGFDGDGNSERLPRSWRMFTASLSQGYGLFSWAEIGGSVDFYSGQEVYAKGQNIGDFSAYSVFRLYQSKNKDRELAAGLRTSFPTGNPHRKETLEDDQSRPDGLTTGDPSVDFFPFLQSRWSFGQFALRGFVEYGYHLPGKIQVGIDVLDEFKNFAPGATLSARIDGIYQHNDKLALLARLNYLSQAENKLDGESLDDATQLLSLIPGMEFQLGPDYDLLLMVELPLLGKNYPRGYPVIAGLKSRF